MVLVTIKIRVTGYPTDTETTFHGYMSFPRGLTSRLLHRPDKNYPRYVPRVADSTGMGGPSS